MYYVGDQDRILTYYVRDQDRIHCDRDQDLKHLQSDFDCLWYDYVLVIVMLIK